MRDDSGQATRHPDAGGTSTGDAVEWFRGRLPSQWFDDFKLSTDRQEIIVIGSLQGVAAASQAEDDGVVARWRSQTRGERIEIAREAEARYGRKISWGVRLGDRTHLFTHVSVPVMTRLRQPERQLLDTLVDAGVARSRSEALGWCVQRTGEHIEDWLAEVREALQKVEELRRRGPVTQEGAPGKD